MTITQQVVVLVILSTTNTTYYSERYVDRRVVLLSIIKAEKPILPSLTFVPSTYDGYSCRWVSFAGKSQSTNIDWVVSKERLLRNIIKWERKLYLAYKFLLQKCYP